MMTQLTRNVQAITQTTHQQPTAQPPPEPDATFDWTRLLQPTPDHFLPATTAQVQRLATGLLAKLPQLTGRDHHEVAFILTMMTDYPNMPDLLANRLYQRANLLYIAVYHGWPTAIAATTSISGSAAIFPPGFQPPPPLVRCTFQQPQARQGPGPTRACGRGRRRGGAAPTDQ